ncbi:MAG TPA: flagellar filament capping protein FliD [Nevskiaceae bacterium]|nr:flagellar filament capping protein FliD [Nevskiaceae bacterium]
MSAIPAVSAAPPPNTASSAPSNVNTSSLSELPGMVAPSSAGLPTTGLITSLGVGSGLDLNSLLSELQTNADQALQPVENQESTTQSEISAFGTIQSALTALGTDINTLANPATFQATAANVQGSSVTASTETNAPVGQYAVDVTQLATASSVATLGVASETADLGAGSIAFTLGSGKTASVNVSAGSDSLQDVANAINAANVGVRASIINDGSGSPWRLVLQSSTTGTAAAVSSVSFSGALASSLSLDSTTQITAQNAALTVDGIAVTSASNTVQDAIAGTTLTLASTGASTVSIAADSSAIANSVQSFVTDYNAVIGAVNKVASYDASTNVAGPLFANSTVQGVTSQLASFVDGLAGGGGGFSGLAQLGVTLNTDGTLSFNSSTFDAAFAGNPTGVAQFFTGTDGTNGFASAMNTAVQAYAGPTGLIDSSVSGLKSLLTSLQQQQSTQQQEINATMANYQQEFETLDTTMAQLQSTSSYLTSALADGSSSSGSSSSSTSSAS